MTTSTTTKSNKNSTTETTTTTTTTSTTKTSKNSSIDNTQNKINNGIRVEETRKPPRHVLLLRFGVEELVGCGVNVHKRSIRSCLHPGPVAIPQLVNKESYESGSVKATALL